MDAVVEVDEARQIGDAVPLIGWPVAKLWRTGASVGLWAQICEWQFMHVWVDGMPAKADVSTVVWQ